MLTVLRWAGTTGCMYLQQQNFAQAESTFLSMSKLPACKHDPYCWLGLAVLNLHKAHGLLESSQVCPACLDIDGAKDAS